MDVEIFWNVIEQYNRQTYAVHIVLLVAIATAIILSCRRIVTWAVKFVLLALYTCYCVVVVAKEIRERMRHV